ncbi:F-box domain-containing protein [Mycena kentingensis (nom. inval.)]|nr:F-box domain-containing protein [Mycena kentingensis (nom. inval.)]
MARPAVLGSQLLITHFFFPTRLEPVMPADVDDLEALGRAFPVVDNTLLEYIRSNLELPEPRYSSIRHELQKLEALSMAVQRAVVRRRLVPPKIDTKTQTPALNELDARLKNSVDDYRCALAPIRRVPEEVLCEIFAAFSAANDRAAYHDVRASMLRLLAVCRRWRSAALSCSMLWAWISVQEITQHAHGSGCDADPDWDACDHLLPAPEVIRRARLRLRNAGTTVPLSIVWTRNIDARVRAWTPDSDDEEGLQAIADCPTYSEFLNELLPSSARWSYLQLNIAVEEMSPIARSFKKATADFPALRRVKLVWDCLSRRNIAARCGPFLESLPALEHLTMVDRPGASATPFNEDSAPWGRLCSCRLQDCGGDYVLAILPHFGPGTTVHLHNITSLRSQQTQTASVTSQINALFLDDCETAFLAAILARLVAPRLTDLRILRYYNCSVYEYSTTDCILSIVKMLTRASCQLLKFGFDIQGQAAFVAEHFPFLLASPAMAALRELDLHCTLAAPWLVNTLAAMPELAPNLCELGLRYRTHQSPRIEDSHVMALKENRPALRMLWFQTGTLRSIISGAMKNRLRDAGLHVVSSSKPRRERKVST